MPRNPLSRIASEVRRCPGWNLLLTASRVSSDDIKQPQPQMEMACSRTVVLVASLILAGLILGIKPSEVQATENWPQWRGPNFNGSSNTASPPVHWSKDKNIQWRLPLPGQGNSTPIIWGEKLFLLSAIKTDKVNFFSEAAKAPFSATKFPSKTNSVPGSRLVALGTVADNARITRAAFMCLLP